MNAATRIAKARTQMLLAPGQAFFATLALPMPIIERGDVRTMATDGQAIYFRPDFVETLSDPELMGVVAHEILHCALQHISRREGRDPDSWNVACDYAVNPIVLASGFRLPAGALVSADYDGLSAEAIFALRRGQQKQSPPQGSPGSGQQSPGQSGGASPSSASAANAPGQGAPAGPPSGSGGSPGQSSGNGSPGASGSPSGQQSGNGSGAELPGQSSDPGGCGGVLDSAPAFDPAKAAEIAADWEIRVRQAIAVARAQGAGRLPGALESLAAEIAKPRIDWKGALRRFVDDSVTRDFSWMRPNRRHIAAGLYLPGVVPDRPSHVVALLDTSGSISDEVLSAFRAELQAMLDEGAADRVTVAYADTTVSAHASYEAGDTIERVQVRRGGTDFRAPLAWASERDPQASAVVYMTDCVTSDWGLEPGAPILWLVTGDPRQATHYAAEAPFGESIILGE